MYFVQQALVLLVAFSPLSRCAKHRRSEDRCISITPITISEQVLEYPIYISTYISANTVLNINGAAAITISNGPTFLDTVVTATTTTQTTVNLSGSLLTPTTSVSNPASISSGGQSLAGQNGQTSTSSGGQSLSGQNGQTSASSGGTSLSGQNGQTSSQAGSGVSSSNGSSSNQGNTLLGQLNPGSLSSGSSSTSSSIASSPLSLTSSSILSTPSSSSSTSSSSPPTSTQASSSSSILGSTSSPSSSSTSSSILSSSSPSQSQSSSIGSTSSPSSSSTSSSSITSSSSSTSSSSLSSASSSISSSLSSTSSSISSSLSSTSSSISSSSLSSTSSSSISSPSLSSTSSSSINSSSLSSISSTISTSSSSTTSLSPLPTLDFSVSSTILVIATDSDTADEVASGLNAYGIPYQYLIVPSGGVLLPELNSTDTTGNFGGLVVIGSVSYYYASRGYQSALTDDQWQSLYQYQISFGVRMIQINVYPGVDFGTEVLGGCCATGIEHTFHFTNTSAFLQAGLNEVEVSTLGLYHYTALVTDTSTTTEIAQFSPNDVLGIASTAAVINNFDGREQMVFFIAWATSFAPTSSYLQHAWITWITRGLYVGLRRTYLNVQVDDFLLSTLLFNTTTDEFRLRVGDMDNLATWTEDVNSRLLANNPGSNFTIELGYNGDGTITTSSSSNVTDALAICDPGPIYYINPPDSTTLEFVKPLGTGIDSWPFTPTNYTYDLACLQLDDLISWFMTPTNRDVFFHISNTFTHELENNATYADIYKEIMFNQFFLDQSGISLSPGFTSQGLIPPAITGLHNGDALQAWWDLGIRSCVGDNARPALVNAQNNMWPYVTSVANDGFAGMVVIPRISTNLYSNCDTPDCSTTQWITNAGGSGNFSDLLAQEMSDNVLLLMNLRHDAHMFDQANLRNLDATNITINGVSARLSIFQAWVETIWQEYSRLTNWPLLSSKQQAMYYAFTDRLGRDACGYELQWLYGNGTIYGASLTATNMLCTSEIPITFPGDVRDDFGFRREQIGSDPLTIWVTLSGTPLVFTLQQPVPAL